MHDASLVDVAKRGDELTNERSGDVVVESAVLLALDVRQQLAALGVLRHQTVQRRRLQPHDAPTLYRQDVVEIFTQ